MRDVIESLMLSGIIAEHGEAMREIGKVLAKNYVQSVFVRVDRQAGGSVDVIPNVYMTAVRMTQTELAAVLERLAQLAETMPTGDTLQLFAQRAGAATWELVFP